MGKSKNHEKKSKKKHKHKDRKEKKKKSKKSKEKKIKTNAIEDTSKEAAATDKVVVEEAEEDANFAIPIELMNINKSHAPQTPEEYKKRQSHIRRVTDPVSGRIRLIRGDGEVLEEIVSKDRHLEINKTATHGDGRFFQHKTIELSKTKEK